MTGKRLRLYGKKVTQDNILEEINRLLYGKGNRPFPLKPSEIGKVIGLNRASVYQYIKKLSQRGDLPTLPSGRLALPKVDEREYRRFNEHHEITSDPLVSEWMDDLLTRRRGLPIKCWKTRLCSLETICNTCKVNPSDLITSTKNTEKIMREFAMHFQNGTVERSKMGRRSMGMNSTIYVRVQGVRDFCAFYDITWRKGVKGIMSQKVSNHGKYPDIRFTAEEFAAADKFIKERWGLDSDVYRWFWIGVESCARFND